MSPRAPLRYSPTTASLWAVVIFATLIGADAVAAPRRDASPRAPRDATPRAHRVSPTRSADPPQPRQPPQRAVRAPAWPLILGDDGRPLLHGACVAAPREHEAYVDLPTPSDPSVVAVWFDAARLRGSACVIDVQVLDREGGSRSSRAVPCDADDTRVGVRFHLVPRVDSEISAAGTFEVAARPGDSVVVARRESDEAHGLLTVGASDGPCPALAVALSIHVVRADPDAGTPAGTTRTAVVANVAALLAHAGEAYASCGVVPTLAQELDLVDSPPPFVLSVAEGDGLPARGGGEIRFRANGQPIGPVRTVAMASPEETAHAIAASLRAAGLGATVRPLPRLDRAAGGAADILVFDARGRPVTLDYEPSAPLSSDARQRVVLGRVDFADGLDDYDFDRAQVGTLEERTLMYAHADADPTTIDAFIVERFTSTTRQGESFIPRDGSPFMGSVIVDRAGVFHDPSTYTLAHEIGHVLLDDPFHPTGWRPGEFPRVMGSDSGAIDSAIVRYFSAQECDRMRFAGRRWMRPLGAR